MIACTQRLMIAALAAAVCGAAVAQDPHRLRVLTFNVLVDLEKKPEVPAWDDRKDLCVQVIREADPDLIGFQETSPAQAKFFEEQFPSHQAAGAVELSESEVAFIKKQFPIYALLKSTTYTDSILMFRRDLFEKLSEGHWWHSPTPDELSVGFGNSFPRIAVWAKLRHLPSGREFVACNTHFDNTLPSQIHMAKLSHEKLQPFVDAGLPVIFMGDFNTDQKRGDYPALVSGGWRDAYLASPLAGPGGRDDNVSTTLSTPRIDHIFYHGDALNAVEWRRLDSPDPAKNLSDHRPVFAILEWR